MSVVSRVQVVTCFSFHYLAQAIFFTFRVYSLWLPTSNPKWFLFDLPALSLSARTFPPHPPCSPHSAPPLSQPPNAPPCLRSGHSAIGLARSAGVPFRSAEPRHAAPTENPRVAPHCLQSKVQILMKILLATQKSIQDRSEPTFLMFHLSFPLSIHLGKRFIILGPTARLSHLVLLLLLTPEPGMSSLNGST